MTSPLRTSPLSLRTFLPVLFMLAGAGLGARAQAESLDDVLARLNDDIQAQGGTTSTLDSFAVRDADIGVLDEVTGLSATAPHASLALTAKGRALNFDADVEMSGRAADYFASGTLPIGDQEQSFDDYIRSLSSTTGSPMVFCRRNAGKVEFVLRNIETVLGGLTRGLDLSILDNGFGEQNGRMIADRLHEAVKQGG